MRSLTVKLTLAFLLVGATGAILVALLLGVRTRSEFDRLRSERDQTGLVQSLGVYYSSHGSWSQVDSLLTKTSQFEFYSRSMYLTDANGVVVFGNERYPIGQTLPKTLLDTSTTIKANDNVVGFAYFVEPQGGFRPPPGVPPGDRGFLDRVTWAAAVSAGIAALLALLLGSLLARTLTRPVRELTAATEAMAQGNFDQQVVVRSRDEIGELAHSFNQMSSDLARASHLRKQMTADLAHDLRTPLSVLRGYTEGLQDGRLQGAPKIYAIMHGEVEHLQRMVEDLRVLSLADAGELPLNRRPVDPAALLERTGLAYIVQAEENGIALRVEADEALPSITVDTDRMTQVLNNLVSNALRYTSEGEIALVAWADEQRVYLRVRDTGSGIAPNDVPFIFDRFYRADKARQRTDSPASGLGLAITKAIVEVHGGTIVVESTLGVGTMFTIAIPVSSGRDDGERPLLSDHRSHSSRSSNVPSVV